MFLLIACPSSLLAQEGEKNSSRLEQNDVQSDILSQEERRWLKEHPEITLGYVDSQEPQLIVNSDGTYSGIVVDLIDELNRRLDTTIRLEAYPVNELIRKARDGVIDGLCNLHPGFADRLKMLKTNGYFQNYPALFTRRALDFSGPEDIPGKTVAIIDKAFFSEKIIKEYEDQVTIKRVTSALEGLQKVASGEVDLFIGVSHNSYLLAKYQLYDISAKYIYTDYSDRVVMAIRPDWPVLTGILNKGLSTFSDVDLNQIVTRWVQAPEQKPGLYLTAEERDWLAKHPDIELGYTDAAEPEIIANPDGSYSGILVDFLAELNRRLGTQIGLEIDTVPGILEQAKTKKVDGILEMLPEYADKFGLLPTATYLSAYPTIFGRHDVSYKGPSDCIGKKVALNDKVLFSEKIAQEYCGQATIVKVSNSLEGLRLVSQGDVAFFVGAGFNSYLIAKYQLFDITIKHTFFDLPSMFGIAVRPDWPELVSILNKGITSFTKNEIDAIVARWVHSTSPKAFIVPTPEEQAWLAENRSVRVRAVDWPPYMIIKENEPPRGIVIEYLKLISKRTGIKFEYEFTKQPFAEFLENMKRGQGVDMTALIAESPEREEYISFTRPYIHSPYVIFAREQDEILLELSDLDGKTVAVPEGFVMQQFLQRDYPGIRQVLFDNDDQALLAVSAGKVDAYIGNLTVSSHIIQKRGLSNLRVVASTPYGDQLLSMGNRTDWPELTSITDKVLASITEEEKTAIRSKYVALRYEQGINKAEVVKWILIIVVIATTLLLMFIFWNRQLARKVAQRTVALENEMAGRAKASEELAESEARFRATFEQAAVGIAHLSTDGHFLRINQQLCNIMGYSPEELMQLTLDNITPAEDLEGDKEQLSLLLTGELDTSSREKRYIRSDGTSLWALVTVSLVRDQEDRPQWFVAVVNDISAQKQAQIALQEMRAYTDNLVQTANVLIISLDLEGRVTHFNPAAETITGYCLSEIEGRDWFEVFVRDGRYPEVRGEFERLVQGGICQSYENPIVTKSGVERVISWSNSRIEREGKIIGLTSFGLDITKRKHAEEALKESEEQFRQLVEQAPFSIQLLSTDGRITKVNQSFMDLWGVSENSLMELQEKYNVLEDEEARDQGVMPLIEKAFKGEAVVLPEIEYDAGHTMDRIGMEVKPNKRWIQARFYPVKNGKGEIIRVVDIEEDITDRRQAEEQVRDYQQRLKALASQLTIAEEKERRRLAAELHDHVGQSLVFSRIQLSGLMEQTSDQGLKESIDEVSQSLLEIIKDTRELVFDLSSPLLHEVGLSAATSQWLSQDIGEKYGLETEFIDNSEKVIHDNEMKSLLFRNIRELLTNVVKHAYAKKVSVCFENHEENLVITVEDSGIGFSVNRTDEMAASKDGFGLFSIQERLDDVGGALEIESPPGKGCRVTMTVPLTI